MYRLVLGLASFIGGIEMILLVWIVVMVIFAEVFFGKDRWNHV